MSNKIKKIPKKRLIAGLAGASAVAAIAIALSTTLATTPVDTKFTNPNPTFPVIEVGETVPHAMRGALSITPTGSIEVLSNGINVLPTAKAKAPGAGHLSLASKYFAWDTNYEGVDSNLITGYHYDKGLAGYAPSNAASYQINYSVYVPGETASSSIDPDRAKITWTSASPIIDSISPSGLISLSGNGIATLVGAFTDCWGVPHDVIFTLYVGDTSGNVDLSALEAAIAQAETELAKTSAYTPESLSALQTEVDTGKSVLNQADPDQTDVNNATQDILQTTLDLQPKAVLAFTALESALTDAGLELAKDAYYTQESLAVLEQAEASGQDVLINPSATQVDIDAATLLIQNAITALVPETVYEYTAFTFVLDTSITPSDSTYGSSKKQVNLQIGANAGNNYSVDWGDGGAISNNSNTHTYADEKEYVVTIYGPMPGGIVFGVANRGETRLKKVLTPLLPQDGLTFSYLFSGCSNLSSVPKTLFERNPSATGFGGIFRNCTSLVRAPSGLFDRNTAATTFQYAFEGCSNLHSIPENIFDKNTEVKIFSYVFSKCISLTVIPEGIFSHNPKVTAFEYAFYCCTSMTMIPEGIFAHNPDVSTFKAVFAACTKIKIIHNDMFDHNQKVTIFEGAFSGCTGFTNALPELWIDTATKFPLLTNTATCFYQCTGATNYGQVPPAWINMS